MRAVKGNKAYIVDETSKGVYAKAGFDIVDDDGNIIEVGKGKTVSYEEYAAVKSELDELKSGKKSKK